MLLPKAIAYYRSRREPSTYSLPIRPVPPPVQRSLIILFTAAAIFLLRTLPFFSPENVFILTSSRLQIPTDVLFTRLSALRKTGLTPSDELMRSKISSLDSRLLFFLYGPDVIRDCAFCNAEDPRSYLYFALPALAAPHLANLVILAVVTSGLFTGNEGARWRTVATLAAAALGLLEVYLVGSYNPQTNARATRLRDIDLFFWNMRIYRGIAIAAMDGAIGWILYLSSTNRAFVNPPVTAERIETSIKLLDVARSKLGAAGILRNTINRDEELRSKSLTYWIHEGRVMNELMEEREVVEGVRNALEDRINMPTIVADAEAYANSVVTPLHVH
jgi:hypothetical protein